MPNGTSDTFYVKRADLAQLIDEIGGDLVVGDALDMGRGISPGPVAASALKKLLRDYDPTMSPCPGQGDDVFATEQDHGYYILHLNTWVSVEKESPLFKGLDRLREDWLRRLLERLSRQ
jgi:hypothetical protein